MAQRVGILNGSNLMQDKDVGTLIDVLTNATSFVVGTGLAVSTNSVAAGKCLIKCTRTSTTPNETVWVAFENTAAVVIDTSGTKKVWVAITQANINDGTLNTDPSGGSIGAIATGAAYPASNFIPLASITGGVITDERPTTTLASHSVNGIFKTVMGTPIASATTLDLSTVVGNRVHVTGTTAITGLGTVQAGTEMTLIFDGVLNFTHNGTSLILPGGATIATAAGDIAYVISEGSGNWRCSSYQKANGQSIVATTDIHGLTLKTTVLADADEAVIWDSLLSANRRAPGSIMKYFNQFGDGSDGDVTITTTVTLTRDMYYNNLTVTSPGILDPNGFKIYFKETLSGNGTIRRPGNTGGGGGFPGAGAAGVALNAGSLGAETPGSAGGNFGNVGSAGVSSNPCYSTTNGVAGVAGAYAGGAAGTSTRGPLYNIFHGLPKCLDLLHPASVTALVTQYKGGSGSGGGGGGTSSFSGGGSGSQGGTIWICGKVFNFTGAMESIGGAGGPGTDTTGFGGTAGAGGSGGQGGAILLFGRTFTSVGTQTVTGGVGGTGGRSAGEDARVTKKGNNGNLGVSIQVTV